MLGPEKCCDSAREGRTWSLGPLISGLLVFVLCSSTSMCCPYKTSLPSPPPGSSLHLLLLAYETKIASLFSFI